MDKKIHIFYVNKIKDLELKIFEQEDDDYPNRHITSACERHIEKWLDKAGIKEKDLRQEVRSCINWASNNCAELLKNKGWTVLYGKEEFEWAQQKK